MIYVPTATREELYEAIVSEPDLYARFSYSRSEMNAHPINILREKVTAWVEEAPDI